MANVLVVAELSEDGKLKKSTLSAITFARQALPTVGGTISIIVLGGSTAAAERASRLIENFPEGRRCFRQQSVGLLLCFEACGVGSLSAATNRFSQETRSLIDQFQRVISYCLLARSGGLDFLCR